jgi:hypothetical protein
LDALQVSLWDKAMNGDVKAVGMVLKIIQMRSRLLGLYTQGFGQGAQTEVMSPAESAAWKGTPGSKQGVADVTAQAALLVRLRAGKSGPASSTVDVSPTHQHEVPWAHWACTR